MRSALGHLENDTCMSDDVQHAFKVDLIHAVHKCECTTEFSCEVNLFVPLRFITYVVRRPSVLYRYNMQYLSGRDVQNLQ